MSKVVLIPGHGGFDSGSCNQTNGVRECDGNLAVALKVKELLEYNNFEVAISRTTDIACGRATTINQDINNQIYFGNNSGADIAVAIHFNGSINETAHGVETLYSQYNRLTDKNIKLATLLLEELVSATGLTNRGLKDSGKSVGVVRAINIPVSLTECAFVTNPNEVIWCSDSDHQLILAKAHAKAICRYYGIEYKENGGIDYMKVGMEVSDMKVTMNGNTVIKSVILTVDGKDTTYIPAVALRNDGYIVTWDGVNNQVNITK
ncbi:MAG: N-acetylmuramoyl-L-alanine amidase [Tissierellia bacterium]|nr:N-acetylmuramoyl-L-alanine amidase [Tissierellia bacterium]